MDEVAPGSLFVNPDAHPPDEALGPLGGSLKRGVDEVSRSTDDARRDKFKPGRFDPSLLFVLLQFVAQAFAFPEVSLEEQQKIVGKALENRMTLLGLKRAGPGLALVQLAFELMEDFLGCPSGVCR